MQRLHPKTGWIEAISGSMFSGKSEELIRRLRRAEIAKQRVQIFKPALDDRYEENHIVSHSQMKLRSIPVRDAEDLLTQVDDRADVIGVDEAQFFDERLVEVCIRLANRGKRVLVAGLDLDYRGKPFDPMPQILATAEYVDKQLAICMVCGAPANYTQRLTKSQEQIEIGAAGMYEARCRYCFEPPAEEPQPGDQPPAETRSSKASSP
jgi:thymidine kinase